MACRLACYEHFIQRDGGKEDEHEHDNGFWTRLVGVTWSDALTSANPLRRGP